MMYKGKYIEIPEPEPRVDDPALRMIFDHDDFKKKMIERMHGRGLFWSYDVNSLEKMTDEALMESAFIHGDLLELAGLLYLYPLDEIKRIWAKTFLQGTHLKLEGEFVASFLFNEKVKL